MVLKHLAVLTTLAIAVAGPAFADQGPTFGGPIGATDINNALLPAKPGLYLSVTALQGYAMRITNNDQELKPGSSAADITAGYLLYKYPFKLFSGQLASGIQTGYEWPGHISVPNLGKSVQTIVGWRDLYVDFIDWSKTIGPVFGEQEPPQRVGTYVPYGLTIKLSYAMIFPTGTYHPHAVTSPGSNTIFYIPNIALTYLTPPDKLGGPFEFDLHGFYDARAENPANDYSNGSVVDFDYALVQRTSHITYGLTGAYAFQVSDDYKGPAGDQVLVSPKGDHIALFTLGPIIAVPIPAWHAALKIKAPFAIFAKNTLMLNTVVATLSFPL